MLAHLGFSKPGLCCWTQTKQSRKHPDGTWFPGCGADSIWCHTCLRDLNRLSSSGSSGDAVERSIQQHRPGWDRAPMRSFTSWSKDVMLNMLHLRVYRIKMDKGCRLWPHLKIIVYSRWLKKAASSALHCRSRIYPLRGSIFLECVWNMLKWVRGLYINDRICLVSPILTCFSSKLKVPLQGKDGISSQSCWDLTANSFKTALLMSKTKHSQYDIYIYVHTYLHVYMYILYMI